MANFTSDYLFDSRKEKAPRSYSGRNKSIKGPKRSTVNRLIAYSRALEVKNTDNLDIEVVLN